MSARVRCSVFIAASLDGFIARPGGEIDWLSVVERAGEDYGYRAFFAAVDTLVVGRKTYELALGFDPWPYAGKRAGLVDDMTLSLVPILLGDGVRLFGDAAGDVRLELRKPLLRERPRAAHLSSAATRFIALSPVSVEQPREAHHRA